MHIGLDGDRRDRSEIIVFAAEIVEVVFDLGRDIFDQAELDPGADREAGPIIGEILGCGSDTAAGENILGVRTRIQAPPALA